MSASYPTYKSTSIPWLPEMPEHWELRRNKYLLKEINERSLRGEEDLLSVSQYTGVTLKKDRLENEGDLLTTASTLEGYKIVRKDDLVINIMLAWNGSLGVSDYDGITSPAYCVYRFGRNINPKYYHYLFRTDFMKLYFRSVSSGVIESRLRMYTDDFYRLYSFLPPLPEQTAIANYLDAKTEQINRFIEKKEKLIALLKEQKQAVINELLEDKEGKWERRKLRHAIKGKLKYGANESGIPYNPEYPRYIRITDFGSDGKLRNDDMLSLLPSVAKDYILKDGDILFARSGGTVGKTFQYKKSDADESLSCYAGYLIKAEPNEKVILSDFLYIYTLSGYYEQWKQGIFNKATIENIGADKYSQLLIPVPPIETQKLILSNINSETTKIDDAILRIEREIEKVKELKQSLIAEVVTGKIKVA